VYGGVLGEVLQKHFNFSIRIISYGFKRTDGNVWKSIMFIMYFLVIKIGLIAPNVPSKLDHHQPNPQLVSRIQPLPFYSPYVSVLDDYRPSDLYMTKIEQPVPVRTSTLRFISF